MRVNFVRCQLCLVLSAVWLRAAPPQERLTLEQAVSEALENNLSLLAERVNIAIAEARVLTARLRPNPVLSTGGDHLDLLGTGFSEINAAGPAEFTLRTDLIRERAGKRRGRIEAAEGARSVAELQFLNSVRATILDVQNAFVDVLLANAGLALVQENLESLNRIVEVNTARVRAGDLAEVELGRSRLAAFEQENAVRRAQLAVRTALNRLQTLLGRKSLSPTLTVTGEMRRDTAAPSPEELRELALKARPDLRALHRDRQRAAAELRLQLAQGKVDYTLGAEYRRQQGLAGTGNSLGLFLSVPLPLFDRNQGEIERARHEERQVQLRLRALETAIAGELENAYQRFLTARGLLEGIEGRMLQQARDVRDITRYSYQRGEATLLELLDAQRAFNDTMQAYNEARAEYARGLYLLEAVSGKAVSQ